MLPWDILPANEIPTMQKISDILIWRYAENKGYQIVTFDEDFVDLQNMYGYPPKIIWLRMGNVSTQEIASKMIELEQSILTFLTDQDSGILEIY